MSIAAIRTTKALRIAFLEHTLRQEAWYFDEQGNGSIASQVTTNGNKINAGIAEKLSIFFQSLATFLVAFIVALAVQWKLALITMSIIPAIFVFLSVCVPIDARIESRILKTYSAAASLAEVRVISPYTSSRRTLHVSSVVCFRNRLLDHSVLAPANTSKCQAKESTADLDQSSRKLSQEQRRCTHSGLMRR